MTRLMCRSSQNACPSRKLLLLWLVSLASIAALVDRLRAVEERGDPEWLERLSLS